MRVRAPNCEARKRLRSGESGPSRGTRALASETSGSLLRLPACLLMHVLEYLEVRLVTYAVIEPRDGRHLSLTNRLLACDLTARARRRAT